MPKNEVLVSKFSEFVSGPFQSGPFGYRVKRDLFPTCFQFHFQKTALVSRFQCIAWKRETRAGSQCQKVYVAEARTRAEARPLVRFLTRLRISPARSPIRAGWESSKRRMSKAAKRLSESTLKVGLTNRTLDSQALTLKAVIPKFLCRTSKFALWARPMTRKKAREAQPFAGQRE